MIKFTNEKRDREKGKERESDREKGKEKKRERERQIERLPSPLRSRSPASASVYRTSKVAQYYNNGRN